MQSGYLFLIAIVCVGVFTLLACGLAVVSARRAEAALASIYALLQDEVRSAAAEPKAENKESWRDSVL